MFFPICAQFEQWTHDALEIRDRHRETPQLARILDYMEKGHG